MQWNDIANLVNDIAELHGWESAKLEIHDDGRMQVCAINGERIEVGDFEYLDRLAQGIEDSINLGSWPDERI